MIKRRILAIDDSKTQLIFLKMALEENGFEVITADDGLEGVSKVFIEKPELIISDIQMPELSGHQLCRLLKNTKETQDIPIILLTCLDQPQDKFWGIRAGADKYIVKSSDFSSLLETTQKLLAERSRFKTLSTSTLLPDKPVDMKSPKSRLNFLLDKLLFETTLSNEATRLAGFIDSRNELLKEVSNLVFSLIDFSCLCLCLYENNKTLIYFDIKTPLPDSEFAVIKNKSIPAERQSSHEHKEETLFLSKSKVIDNTSAEKILSDISSSLVLNENCLGSISVFSTKETGFSQSSKNVLQLLAKDFPMLLKLMLLYDETKRLSITDGLSGLNNNRYFKEIFALEFERAQRSDRNLSLILIDIDHFKPINDKFGHLQGDLVIQEISRTLKQTIRKGDFAARYGGEEFAVLAFDTDLESTAGLAEKIRQKIEQMQIKAGKQDIKITISLGVSTLSKGINSIFDLIKQADVALYKAKGMGRNRVYAMAQGMPQPGNISR